MEMDLLASIQAVETYGGYKMVIWGDELSPNFVIFSPAGEDIEGGGLDMTYPSLKAYVDGLSTKDIVEMAPSNQVIVV